MSTYATRQTVKDQGAKVSPAYEASDEFSMAAIANLLEEHRQALSADFKASISILETKLDHVHTTVSDHTQKIVSLEANATRRAPADTGGILCYTKGRAMLSC